MISEWQQLTLGDVTMWSSGGTPKKDLPEYWNGDIPWISANSMHSTRLGSSDLKITEAGLESGSRLAEKDSILLLVRGGALHNRIPVGIATRDVAFNQDVKALKAKTELISPWYLLFWLMAHERFLLASVVEYTGIGAGKLDTKRMQGLPFLVPPPNEREAIENLARALDDRIELLRETNATLEAIAQALFKSWFVDFDPVHARARGEQPAGLAPEVAALFPDSFEESDLGKIPKGWTIGRVEDLMELAYGKALKATARIDGPIPVYGSGGITGYHNESLVNGPSIIVGRKGTVGSLYWEDLPFFPIDTVFYVKTQKPQTYCFYLLQRLGLKDMNTDAAVPGLNRNNVYRLQVLIPPEEVLAAFDNIASVLRHRIFSNNQQSQTLANLRDTLLPRLISGQLRLPDAEAMVSEAQA
ncbi:restriction endonuclease subunit S [Aeromonas caviae]|uniref:restriction endonuclease subunit S n=1 Tax=Aeromonas caviae TaxID=648 RepID=UPI002DBBD245|nr:restriction endonuclease subunit S [Aeromonas caviae]MEB5775992.1 restriction endonuclease subunit S [Aeromonas caviae]MEB6651194.1 restriction endonuclease subunit S [Aeromonas caviae]